MSEKFFEFLSRAIVPILGIYLIVIIIFLVIRVDIRYARNSDEYDQICIANKQPWCDGNPERIETKETYHYCACPVNKKKIEFMIRR